MEQKTYVSLIGDIGGTNMRLRIIEFTKTSEDYTLVYQPQSYIKAANFKSFEEVLAHFFN